MNPAQINQLYQDLVVNSSTAHLEDEPFTLAPVELDLVVDRETLSHEVADKYRAEGNKLISEGRVAVVVLAGGQGTRLGSDKPKGVYDIGLPSHKSIFQILTERFLKAEEIGNG